MKPSKGTTSISKDGAGSASILRTSQAINKLAGARTVAKGAKENTLARTVKFGINVDDDPALKNALFQHIKVCESFRRNVLGQLQEWWERDPDDFRKAIGAKGKSPYVVNGLKKTSCYAVLSYKYAKGAAKHYHGLSSMQAGSVVNSLGGTIKSFITRHDNVIGNEIKPRADLNRKDWETILAEVVPNLSEAADRKHLPEPPPALAEPVTQQTIDDHNAWVARARVWVNLVLRQKYKLDKEAAPMPLRLKGFPSFPGKMRYAKRDEAAWRAKLMELLAHARACAAGVGAAFDDVTADEWGRIAERYQQRDGNRADAKTVFAGLAHRVAALSSLNPDWTPRQRAEELASGLLHRAEKLEAHLTRHHCGDRQAARKLAIICNALCALALEPLRVRAAWSQFADTDAARLSLYGEWRGLLTQPTDENAAVEITGFGVKAGTMQYGGVLAFRKRGAAEHDHDWAFVYSGTGGRFSLLTSQSIRRGSSRTEWQGIATTGGKKGADGTNKSVVIGTVWMTDNARPAILPLQFGKMQGRHYLWNKDGDITKGAGWVPMSAKLLCEWPPSDWTKVRFFLALALSKTVRIATDRLAASVVIGIDRGEKIPACYGIVNARGKRLASGRLAAGYRAAVEALQEHKQQLQRSKGGYTRALRKDERNLAQSMCGAVAQQILHLSATHDAPVVLEELTSGIATRGGKRTFMSAMQYSRIQSALEQKFAEAGRYVLPSQPKYRGKGNGVLRFVMPHHTSQTCSCCGTVHDAEFYESLLASLRREGDGAWAVRRPDGSLVLVPASYDYITRGGDQKTRQVYESLNEAFGFVATYGELRETAKKNVRGWIKRALDYRPAQEKFVCLACGHEDHADEQAAVNIARKHLLTQESGRGPTKEEWKQWVARRCREGWA